MKENSHEWVAAEAPTHPTKTMVCPTWRPPPTTNIMGGLRRLPVRGEANTNRTINKRRQGYKSVNDVSGLKCKGCFRLHKG